jgi:Cu-processing system permease protein
MTRALTALLLFARHERILAVRSRWTQVFAAVFAALALAVAGSGYVLSGGHGIQDFARTTVSLVQLVLFVVPLTALLLGAMALAPDRGAAEMMFSQPVGRATILLGRLLGLFQALVAAQAIGFGVAGLVIFSQSGEEGVLGFVLVFVGSAVLTAVFLGIAAWIAAGGAASRRARTLALALVVWFATVVLFDIVALGLASLLPSGTASRLLIVSVIVNPVDAVRTGALMTIEGTAAFGSASLAFLRFTKGSLGAGLALAASLAAWTVLPTAAALLRLRRADV